MTCKTAAPPSTVEEMIAKAGAHLTFSRFAKSACLTCMNFVSHLLGTSEKKQLHLELFFVSNLLKTLFFFSKDFQTELQAPKCIYVVAEDDLEFHGAFSLQDEPKNGRPCWINDEDMSHLVFDKEIECWKVCNDVEVTWHHTYVTLLLQGQTHTEIAVCVALGA